MWSFLQIRGFLTRSTFTMLVVMNAVGVQAWGQNAEVISLDSRPAKTVVQALGGGVVRLDITLFNPLTSAVKVHLCEEDRLCVYSVRFEQRWKTTWKPVKPNENMVLGDGPWNRTKEYAPQAYTEEHLIFRPEALAFYDRKDTRLVILGFAQMADGLHHIEIYTQPFRLSRRK